MRRIAKPWPPTNVSPDNREARTLRRAEKEYLESLAAAQDKTSLARMHFDQLEKCKLREVMHREQRSICVYCERQLEDGHGSRIEHWRPLSEAHQHALNWNNLYLSCPTLDTCDNAKRYRPLKWNDTDPDLPWPTELAYETVVGFTTRGEMYVRKNVLLDEPTRQALELAIDRCQERAAILNLNSQSLVSARAAAIDSEKLRLERAFPGRHASREERAQRAIELLARNPLPQFVSIRCAWLLKTTGDGR